MTIDEGAFDATYRRGFRDGVAAVVRGLLLVEADEADVGALIGALSRYEQSLEAWLAGELDDAQGAPPWQPTADDIGVDQA